MERDILLDIGPRMMRLAVVEDGALAELYVDRRREAGRVGDVYRARVTRVLPGMQAAFVDIGTDKNAFLYVRDAMPEIPELEEQADGDSGKRRNAPLPQIETLVKAGQEITVQVIKEQAGSKGPRVSTHIMLAGHLTILVPGTESVGISKKITSTTRRAHLRELVSTHLPEHAGIIVRTAALQTTDEGILADIERVTEQAAQMKRLEARGKVPRCLHREPDMAEHAVREHLSVETRRFLVNDVAVYEHLREQTLALEPEFAPKIQLYSRDYDMFAFHGVNGGIDEALSRRVLLPSGATLVFDVAEALTVIDVNTGRFVGRNTLEDTALKTNLEAARVIARQLRLRDLSGVIVIDFIDLIEPEHRDQVIAALKSALKADRTQCVVAGMTRLGLVEMTRKKIRKPLYTGLTEVCPCCGGSGRKRLADGVAPIADPENETPIEELEAQTD